MFIIAGLYRHQRLATPKGREIRPTSNRLREALFSICQPSIEGARFLDIFAGSGALGIEALSRGAQFATFIESNRDAARCIEKNIANLGLEKQSLLLKGDAFTMLAWLKEQGSRFDIIYADPPYSTLAPHTLQPYSTEIVHWLDTHPLLAPGGWLFVEESSRLPLAPGPWHNLTLKSHRRLGEASLRHYTHPS